jgi:Domain of unknown function (DUF5134)
VTAGTPMWLYDMFGVLLLVVAGYSLALLGATVRTSRPAGWDVDVAHLFMGVSMAGMFNSNWAFGPRSVWEFIFAAISVWFAVRGVLSIRRYGVHLSHFFVHAILGLAMFLMYAFPGSASSRSMGAMRMSMPMVTTDSRLGSGVAFALAICLLASAIFTVGSPQKGVSHHGSHSLVYAGVLPVRVPQNRWTYVEGLISTPWVEDASHVAMCVSMGFLLILLS